MSPLVTFQVCEQRAKELGVKPDGGVQNVDRVAAAGLAADQRYHQDPRWGRYGQPLVQVEVEVPEERALTTTAQA